MFLSRKRQCSGIGSLLVFCGIPRSRKDEVDSSCKSVP